ncbi:S-adenosyl-L-methionine-dependent methyltransferase [Xylariaceae sp. FL0804]|nr:S-adenosyl-L-methionine-dependent methyltransferase [Xylariaceae sp. FL0804]
MLHRLSVTATRRKPRNVITYLPKHSLPRVVRTMATEATKTTSPGTDNQVFVYNGEQFTEVKEGLGRILVPHKVKESEGKNAKNIEEEQRVFYNPIQQFNRDLSVLAIKAYGEQVLSKPRSNNAKNVAKRKRDKADSDERESKKQETTPITTETLKPETASSAQNEGSSAENLDMVVDAPQEHGTESAALAPAAGDNITGTTAAADSTAEPAIADETRNGERPSGSGPQGPRFTILDALSATGLRALRYAQEIPFLTTVTANDLIPSAVEAIRRNAEHNGVESKVNATQGDARAHMYTVVAEEAARDFAKQKHNKKGRGGSKRYDAIDLDPYGTAATFFDAAVNAVRDDGGLLCVTCTDSGVWASNGYPEKAYALYGGIPIKGNYSHEVGLRLVLHGLSTAAARYGLAVEPQLSLSIDYYLRVFVKIRKSPAQVKFLAGKTMLVYNCDHGCGAWETQLLARNRKVASKSGKAMYYKHGLTMAPTADRFCKHCRTKMHLAGPMYAGPLHSQDFIKSILDSLPDAPSDIYGTKPRIEGVLQTALEEFLPVPEEAQNGIKEDEFAAIEPYPFYFHPTNLAGAIHSICPDEDSFRGALRHLGYEVTRSHCKAGALKTNAPWAVIWHIMREWARQKQPVKTDKITPGSPAYHLLRLGRKAESADDAVDGQEDEIDKLEVVFDQKLGRDKSKQGLVRFQNNPTKNWGPMMRAKG